MLWPWLSSPTGVTRCIFPKKLQNHAQYIMMLVECLNAGFITRMEKEEKNDFLCGGSVELDI
jgi:hypothetical protein